MNMEQNVKDANSEKELVSFFDVKRIRGHAPKGMFTRKEAAEYLGISVTTLDSARNNGKIAYVQYVENGSVFFTETALEEYVARCTHRAIPLKESMITYRKRRA